MGANVSFALPFPIDLPDRIGGFATPLVIAFDIGLALLVALLLLFIQRTVRVGQHLHSASREGRKLSQTPELTPLTSFRRNGVPGDPLNVRVEATEAQLGAAFASAGWYRADEITLITALRISIDSLLARKYGTAPVSNLYLFGRRQDIAFEQPGSSVRERDHVRFWKAPLPKSKNQRPLWIGGATKDIRVALSPRTHMPTHLIAPDVDTERDFLVEDLSATGWVVGVSHERGFGHAIQRDNGDGGRYYSDGTVAVLSLANVYAAPIAAQVRGSLAARFVKLVLGPLLRPRLPAEGRERADRVQAERAASSSRLKKPGG